MKSLSSYVLESMEILFEEKDKSELKTLRDCLDGYVTIKFKQTVGPNKFSVANYCKLLVKKYKKSQPINLKTGKPIKPNILGDVIAIIADQVQIDWNLDPKSRLVKALEDFEIKFKEMQFDEISKLRNENNYDINDYNEGDYINTDEFNMSAKEISWQKNVVAYITCKYGGGATFKKVGEEWKMVNHIDPRGFLDVYIMDNCPLLTIE